MDRELAILCIEDSESDFFLIERELRRCGLMATCRRVDEPESLQQALEGEHWDVVLSDYSVPGIYFIDTLVQFRKRWPEIPLILVSATLGEVKASAMVKLGARDFVSKDKLEDLVPTIQRHLK